MATRDFFTGAVVGATVVVAIPVTFIVVSGMGAPAARAARRIGGILRDKTREAGIETLEVLEDFVAEVQAGPAGTVERTAGPAGSAAEPARAGAGK
ncbi:MAG: hypothetical protein PVI87_02590 [Gammaproteobacteria bacterium]|jgi:hypothetical protein